MQLLPPAAVVAAARELLAARDLPEPARETTPPHHSPDAP
jgi:hypothetical protein